MNNAGDARAPVKSHGDPARLLRCLNPESIAVIGGAEAARVIQQCRRLNFGGELWPVNPRRETMEGIACAPTVDALPAPPDAAFVAIPAPAAVAAVGELARAGAGGAVCYASGFSEIGGAGESRQYQLVQAAGAMPLIGPNCYGFLNLLTGAALWPDYHGAARMDGGPAGDKNPGGVAIFSQSGNVSLNLTMQRRLLPLAWLVSLGNQAAIGVEDCIAAALAEPRIAAIGLHIEGLRDLARFAELADEARRRRVPLVALKAGRSAAGARITMSHTATLAGEDALYDALFARLGIARVATPEEFIEALKLLTVMGPLPGNRIASMSCSGGEATLVADLAAAHDLQFPPFTDAHRDTVQSTLGDAVTVSNPLDYHTYIWGDRARQFAAFYAFVGGGGDGGHGDGHGDGDGDSHGDGHGHGDSHGEGHGDSHGDGDRDGDSHGDGDRDGDRDGDGGDRHGDGDGDRGGDGDGDGELGAGARNPFDLTLLVLDMPGDDRAALAIWLRAVHAFVDACAAAGARGALVTLLGENLPAEVGRELSARGIAPLQGLAQALTAVAAAADIGRAWAAAEVDGGGELPALTAVAAPAGNTITVDEHQAKRRLAAAGLTVPASTVVDSVDAAVTAAERLGYPVVVKALAADLAHKTEVGAVAVNLRTADEVRAAAARMLTIAARVLVEEFIDGVAEVLLGLSCDAQFGRYLAVGFGGARAELFGDRQLLLPPVTRAQVAAALARLKTAPLLHGYRGARPADVESIVDAAVKLLRMAENDAGIIEVEVNPLVVKSRPETRIGGHRHSDSGGAVAVDALLTVMNSHANAN